MIALEFLVFLFGIVVGFFLFAWAMGIPPEKAAQMLRDFLKC